MSAGTASPTNASQNEAKLAVITALLAGVLWFCGPDDNDRSLTQGIATAYPRGFTNLTILDAAGQPIQTIDKLGHTNITDFDFLGRPWRTTYPDGLSEMTFFDAN